MSDAAATSASSSSSFRSTDDARRQRGIETFATIFGVPESQVESEFARQVGSVFGDEVLLSTGGAAWFHPGLAPRERSLVVITALICQGVTDKRLGTHLRLGMRNGLDEDALTGLATLLASYAGYPRASMAMETILAEVAAAVPNDHR